MQWDGYLMALIYIVTGSFHFITPKVYLRILPDYIPWHKTMVILSGIIEIVLGVLLLFEPTQNLAIYGIILMLIMFLPVHIVMILNRKKRLRLPLWAVYLRIPLQFALMYWAYTLHI